jgi:hypothetical protein
MPPPSASLDKPISVDDIASLAFWQGLRTAPRARSLLPLYLDAVPVDAVGRVVGVGEGVDDLEGPAPRRAPDVDDREGLEALGLGLGALCCEVPEHVAPLHVA